LQTIGRTDPVGIYVGFNINPMKISNILNSGRKTSIEELDMLLLDIDCIPLIIGVCNIIVKLVKKYNLKANISWLLWTEPLLVYK